MVRRSNGMLRTVSYYPTQGGDPVNRSHQNTNQTVSRFGITAKAFTPIIVLAVVMLFVGMIVVRGLMGLSDQMDRVANGLVPSGDVAADALQRIMEERRAVDAMIMNRGDEYVERYESARETAEGLIVRAEDIATGDNERQIADLRAAHGDYHDILENRVMPPVLAFRELRDETLPALSANVVSKLLALEEELNAAGQTDAESEVESALVDVLQTRSALVTFTQHYERSDAVEAAQHYDAVQQRLADVDVSSLETGQREMLAAASEEWERYGEARDELYRTLAAAEEYSENALIPAGETLTAMTAEMVDGVFLELSDMSTGVYEVSQRNIWLVSGIFLLGLVIGVGVGWIVTRGYVKPLLRLDGLVADFVSDMDAGEGDLTRRAQISTRDEVGQLGANVNRFIETLQKVLTTINQETNQLASAAEEMSAITGQTQPGVARQKSETDQVATAMNEMVATVQEIASNASDASTAAGEASESASEGRKVVTVTLEAINALVEAVQDGQRTVHRVDQDAESITEVIDVITGVAEQTNLLALNAAIEAARAGQEGRGFAVVAGEVRELAEKTQESTGKIRALIETLQQGTRSAVSVMEQSAEKGNQTVDRASEAGAALRRIEEQVQVINDMNAQIASAAEEQTAVSNDISRNIESIRGVSDESAQGAQQTAQASEELARLSERLNRLVNQFRI